MNLEDRELGEKSIIRRITTVSIAGNIVLSGFKLIAGIAGKSGAMISDAVHSMSDVFTTVIAVIGVKVSHADPDKEHPYGHERMECVASLILAAILFITGIGIGRVGLMNIITGQFENMEVPGIIALAAAALSIMVKEGMCRYTLHYAKKINSTAFEADGYHHRSDALSSVGALIGIAGARMGFLAMDSVASIIICFFILKTAIDIFREALDQMLDKSCGETYERQMREFVLSQKGVRRVDLLQSRKFGSKVYIDLEISVDEDMPLKQAHEIAETVHSKVEWKYPETKHIMIHVNPYIDRRQQKKQSETGNGNGK